MVSPANKENMSQVHWLKVPRPLSGKDRDLALCHLPSFRRQNWQHPRVCWECQCWTGLDWAVCHISLCDIRSQVLQSELCRIQHVHCWNSGNSQELLERCPCQTTVAARCNTVPRDFTPRFAELKHAWWSNPWDSGFFKKVHFSGIGSSTKSCLEKYWWLEGRNWIPFIGRGELIKDTANL